MTQKLLPILTVILALLAAWYVAVVPMNIKSALTTAELDQSAEDAGIGRWQARLATGLLQRCDAAVYARSRPDPASADHDLTVAYEVVELSRPRYHGEQLDEAASA